MKLSTLNLQGFVDWDNRKENIVSYLDKVDSDIIVFQEVVYLPEISPYTQAQLVNQSLNYPYEYSSITRLQVGDEYETFREGLAVLSKYPVSKVYDLILKKDPLDKLNRIVQLIDVLVDSVNVKIANVHFSVTDEHDFASPQLKETIEFLKSHNEQRIIIGDFNLSSLDRDKSIWEEDYVASTCFPYISFPSENKTIDYILVPKDLEIVSVEVSNVVLSDHNALTAVIQ